MAEEESELKSGTRGRKAPGKRGDWGAGKFIAAAVVVGLVLGALGTYFLAGTGGVDPSNVKEFQLVGYHWSYSQDTIEVEQGDLVVIVLRSAGSNHEMHEMYEDEEQKYLEDIDYNETQWEAEVETDPTLKVHGFRLEAFGIEVDLPLDVPNDIVVVKFVADKTGTFTYRCSNDCGPGHDDMKGTLIVR